MSIETLRILKPDIQYEYWIVKNLTTREEVRESLTESGLIATDDEIEDGLELIDNVEDYLDGLMSRIEKFRKSYNGMTIQLRGEYATRRVWLFDEELLPEESLRLRNHSPDGFSWSYSGSGPAQLALAICNAIMGPDKAMDVYQNFKFKHIASLPQGDFDVDLVIDCEGC